MVDDTYRERISHKNKKRQSSNPSASWNAPRFVNSKQVKEFDALQRIPIPQILNIVFENSIMFL